MTENEYFRYLSIGLPQDIRRMKEHGDFAGALSLLEKRLGEETARTGRDESDPTPLMACLLAEREIIHRMAEEGEFPYDRAEALAVIREQLPDFTEADFDERVDSRTIRWRYEQGEKRYIDSLADTIVKTEDTAPECNIWRRENMERMKRDGKRALRITVRASLRIKDECFTPGMKVRVDLPLPIPLEGQSEIEILSVSPVFGLPAPAYVPQRTVRWEETMETNHEFAVEYSYVRTALYHTPDRGEDEAYRKAKAIYDDLSRMKYTFMPRYFTLEDIPGECLRSRTGDCGIFAETFIDCCRREGVEAEWHSGFAAGPDDCGSHDWAAFRSELYGWLPVDVSFGTSANRGGDEELRNFYFGNLDPYRMTANREYLALFTPPKQFFRVDPYDNQSGEVETDTRGLRFNEFETERTLLVCEDV